MEYRRCGDHWRRAQALVQTRDGPCLVYLVDDVEAAARESGIDAAHAQRVLTRLVETARTLDPLIA